MDLGHMDSLLSDLEHHPQQVQLHHAELESAIAWLMDEVYQVAKSGKNEKRKMQLGAIA